METLSNTLKATERIDSVQMSTRTRAADKNSVQMSARTHATMPEQPKY
ncbi:hypothetical protein [Candidatus Liberibacter sp.]|nr:hypothetical protein [Candidatus Liberibacter sp.]MBA5723720.1 hypothetical protein [Candidatus Liberibacter sp.]